MSFNGSGTFNVNTSGQPVVAGTTITSAAFNALTADLATGLSTAICKDGQTTVTANIPLNNFKITGLGAGTLTGDAARMSQLQSGASQLLTSLTGTDTLTATLLPTLTAYTTGAVYTFVAANTNTTAVTLNIDALGAKAVTRDGSTALVAGDIVAGTSYNVMYDGTRFQLLSRASFTNLSASGNLTLSGGTANGVAYLNGSKVLTTGSGFTYSSTGNLVLAAPSSGTALQVTGLTGSVNTARFTDGANYAVLIKQKGGSTAFVGAEAGFNFAIGANDAANIAINTAGNVTINAPGSGTALTVTGVAGANALSVTAGGGGTMVMDTSGNLGLGVTPTTPLHVQRNGYNTTAGWYSIGRLINAAASKGLDLGYNNGNNNATLTAFSAGSASGFEFWRYTGSAWDQSWTMDSSGSLLVGTTSNTNSSKIFALPTASGPAFACQGYSGDVAAPAALFGKFDNNTTTSQIFLRFTINNGGAGSGQITANGALAAAFGSYSDRRLKENIVDLPPQLDSIMALRPVEFDYIQEEGGGHQIGFIAQEVQGVFPDVVGKREDGMLMLAGLDKTTARLIKAMQEQQAIINDLTQRLAVLEGKE